MKLKTRIFEIYPLHYKSPASMAKAMGISHAQVYRVKEGKSHIGYKFILGAMRAFQGYKLENLFYVEGRP